MRRLSVKGHERWAVIRSAFESGATVAHLARAYNLTEQAIRRVKKSEGWTKPVCPPEPEHVRGETEPQSATSNVILLADRAHTRKKSASVPEPDAGAAVTDEDLVAAMQVAAKRALEGNLTQAEAKALRSVVFAAAKVIDVSRAVAGRKPGQASSAEPDVPVQRVTIIRRTVAAS